MLWSCLEEKPVLDTSRFLIAFSVAAPALGNKIQMACTVLVKKICKDLVYHLGLWQVRVTTLTASHFPSFFSLCFIAISFIDVRRPDLLRVGWLTIFCKLLFIRDNTVFIAYDATQEYSLTIDCKGTFDQC